MTSAMTPAAAPGAQSTRRLAGEAAEERTDGAQTGSLLADLRGGADGAGDAPLAPKPRRKLPTQHLVTLLVLVAGGGALLAMRQYGMGAGMKFDQGVKIDYVESVARKRTAEQERILVDLERGVTATTPQAADIRKNPFKLAAGPSPAPAAPAPDAEAARSAEAQKRRADELASAAAGVVLNGVMGGDTPLARVDGLIVRVGDKVGELFTVVAIQGRSILLTADGQVFVVQMSDAPAAPRPGPQVRTRTPGK